MSFHQLNECCYYYHSSVNIGYVNKGSDGVLIDSGLDHSSAKKILKELTKRNLPLTHLFITHGHADHYGGAAYIQSRYEIHTIAPVLEEAILKNPLLEPLYLFGGNDPFDELQNKFLQGPAVRVDEIVDEGMVSFGSLQGETILVPGHSYHQLAIKIAGILYAADGYFSKKTLIKHKIPFMTDVGKGMESLKRLLEVPCAGAVPGHGEFEEDASMTIRDNISYHEELLDWLHHYLTEEKELSHEEIVAAMCRHYDVPNLGLSQWLLHRTAVTAYLIGLKKAGRVEDRIVNHQWMFRTMNR